MTDIQDAVIAEAVATAKAYTGGPQWMPGDVIDVDGPDCNVEPADSPGTAIPATRMHPDIVSGSRVLLAFWPNGPTLAFGPIPI